MSCIFVKGVTCFTVASIVEQYSKFRQEQFQSAWHL